MDCSCRNGLSHSARDSHFAANQMESAWWHWTWRCLFGCITASIAMLVQLASSRLCFLYRGGLNYPNELSFNTDGRTTNGKITKSLLSLYKAQGRSSGHKFPLVLVINL